MLVLLLLFSRVAPYYLWHGATLCIKGGGKGLRPLHSHYGDIPSTEDTVKLGKREMFMTAFDRACNVSDQFNKAFDMAFEKNKDVAAQKLRKAKADFER